MTLPRPRTPTWLLVASAVVLVTAALIVVGHRGPAREVWRTLAALPVPALGGALLLVLSQFGCQACRLWALLPREAGLRGWRVARAFAVGEWANILAPARAGDALKVVLLCRAAEGPRPLSLPAATGAVLADKVVDAGSFVAVSALAAGWTGVAGGVLRAPLPPAATVTMAVGIGTVVALGIRLTGSRWFARFARWRRELRNALAVLARPGRLLPSACSSFGAWVAEALALRLLCAALGFPVPLPHLGLALATLNVGISVPVTGGNVGVYEGVLAFGLGRAGVPLPAAVAIATAHHALELLATTLGAAALSLGVARPRPLPTGEAPGGLGR